MNTLFDTGKFASFSEDGKHRLWLSRFWDLNKPRVMFIGLNPSTANAEIDDNTIKKVIKIARYNGFGGVYMVNLFTFISTDPALLDIKNGNVTWCDGILYAVAEYCSTVVFAWGNFEVMGRDKIVKALFPGAMALHINKNGSPKHPLYCKDETKLIHFKN